MCPKAAVRGRILLVGKTHEHLADLRDTLLRKHYAVTTVNGFGAISLPAASSTIDVVLLDLSEAPNSCLAFCRALRTAGVTEPILMLNPVGTIDDMLEGFDAGTDVYLRGPRVQSDLLSELALLCREQTNSRWKRMLGL